ncbi:MAG: hypothetical protein KTR16_07015 [Acidiferrobacterales bacterium]|nr:hypothetical protein [Acidiferrobacterales bacterium]
MKRLLSATGAVLLLSTNIATTAAPDITATAQDSQSAIASTSILRTAYAEALQTNIEPPASLSELGYSEVQLQNDNVLHVSIDPFSNAIMVGLKPKFGQNQWLALLPTIENYSVANWACQTTLSEEFTSSTGCRSAVPYDHITQAVSDELFTITLLNLSATRLNYLEHYQTTGDLPTSLTEAGLDSSWLDRLNAEHLIVEPETGALLVGLNTLFGKNQWLALTPNANNYGSIDWKCATTVMDSLAGSANRFCRTELSPDQLLK